MVVAACEFRALVRVSLCLFFPWLPQRAVIAGRGQLVIAIRGHLVGSKEEAAECPLERTDFY